MYIYKTQCDPSTQGINSGTKKKKKTKILKYFSFLVLRKLRGRVSGGPRPRPGGCGDNAWTLGLPQSFTTGNTTHVRSQGKGRGRFEAWGSGPPQWPGSALGPPGATAGTGEGR